MKTQHCNLGKSLLTLVIAGLFSLSSQAANKGHVNTAPVKEAEKSNAPETFYAINSESLSALMQDWMGNGSYWENTQSGSTGNSQLREEMETWMSNGKYWSEAKEDQINLDQLAETVKTWMEKGLYWNSEK